MDDRARNVEFALKLIGVDKAERRERAKLWLGKVHLGRFAEAHPHELSGGMRQRAALARALACDPAVILADEPFAALDAQTREILQNELQRVWEETRKTFVFVTHNVREAVFLADRVIVMSAPPGTLVMEERITAPRPREFEDVLLSKVVVDIHDQLVKEVNKVVAREIGDARAVAQVRRSAAWSWCGGSSTACRCSTRSRCPPRADVGLPARAHRRRNADPGAQRSLMRLSFAFVAAMVLGTVVGLAMSASRSWSAARGA